MKKKALTKEDYGHHLTTAAQIRVSAENFRKEARKFRELAKSECLSDHCSNAMKFFDDAIKAYEKAAKLDENMFNIIDGDFAQIYKRLPSRRGRKKKKEP